MDEWFSNSELNIRDEYFFHRCFNAIVDGAYNRSLTWRIEIHLSWWRHQMETFSTLLAICEFPAQRPVTQRFYVFFDLRLNNRLSKQSWGWWFETLSRPLWRHCNVFRFSHMFTIRNINLLPHKVWVLQTVVNIAVIASYLILGHLFRFIAVLYTNQFHSRIRRTLSASTSQKL